MVEEGARYNWTTSTVRWADAGATAELAAIVTAAQPKLPRPLLSASIVNFEQAVLSRLPEIGYPMPHLIRRDVVVDHATATVALTLDIDPGPRAAFGEVRFEGLDSVKPAHLKRLVPWQTGDAYDARLVDRFRLDLAKTNLFSAIEVETHLLVRHTRHGGHHDLDLLALPRFEPREGLTVAVVVGLRFQPRHGGLLERVAQLGEREARRFAFLGILDAVEDAVQAAILGGGAQQTIEPLTTPKPRSVIRRAQDFVGVGLPRAGFPPSSACSRSGDNARPAARRRCAARSRG